MADRKGDQEAQEGDNFWKQILGEVSAQSSRRFPACKRILVLGNDGCGKTSLITKIRRSGEELLRGSGLEYTYIDVDDEERDEHTRLSVWIQSGEMHIKDLLKYVITKDSVYHSLVLICIDMSKPWNMIDNLDHFFNILREHLHSLSLSAKTLNEMERKVLKEFQSYKDVDISDEAAKRLSANHEEEEEELNQLGENVLVDNLGIPIAVVVTKTDCMSSLEKDIEYREEHFDFIQKHLRKFCLKCGSALVYTSTKESCNTSLLHQYLIHRLYDFPFRETAQIVEKDAIFIPAGWDNTKRISILDEHIKTFDANENFKDRIVKPVSRKMVNQEKEIVAEDEQVFLENQLTILNKEPSPAAGGQRSQAPQDQRSSARMQSPGQRGSGVPRASGLPTSKAKVDPSKASAAQNSSETVLANFFNSLLNKNTTGKAPGGGAGGTGKSASSATANRSDVQAELERMSKKSNANVKKDTS